MTEENKALFVGESALIEKVAITELQKGWSLYGEKWEIKVFAIRLNEKCEKGINLCNLYNIQYL